MRWTGVKERTDIHQRILRVIGIDGKRLDRSSYKLQNGKMVMFRYSKPYKCGALVYWFGLSKEKFERYSSESFFVLFICGSDDQVLVIPSSYLSELLRDVGTAIDNHWKLHIFKRENIFEISVTGKPDEDVSKYLNKYELLVEGTEHVPKTPASMDIEDKIMNLDGVQGNLHDKLADMVRQIGEWMGYKSIRNYRVRPDAPYLDVAWLLNDAIHIAIEVQIGEIRGNLTEVKDRLILAKRFGARKCIIISKPESVERIRSLFRYETEIKHWIEIWGLERIYIMFVSGRIFFENFNEFNRHQYRDDIVFV
ncbi:MAG: hypothetical protein N2V77_04780 [Canidatus Methanoxibalbensis ujae]|nr:hypothetical protein [Candidatus Methanoxibalbensis ujae]